MMRPGISDGGSRWTRFLLRPQARPCCADRRVRLVRWALVLLLLAAALVPLLARPAAPEPGGASAELVAEALFLCDPVPPGGRELSLALALQPLDAAAPTGAGLETHPRVQVALGLADRLGLTAEIGFASQKGRVALDTPGASLKYLLRDPAGGGPGLAASLDLFGSTHSLASSEVGLGLGALQAVGPVTLRVGASAATPTASWGPHLHAGGSAALALSARVRGLVEVVADVGNGERAVAGGPTLKVALGERTTLAAGALLPLGGAAGAPVLTVQLIQGI